MRDECEMGERGEIEWKQRQEGERETEREGEERMMVGKTRIDVKLKVDPCRHAADIVFARLLKRQKAENNFCSDSLVFRELLFLSCQYF